MRHQVAMRKLGRTATHRQALLKNMASSLIMHGRIRTTVEKAKELRRVAEKLVTIGKKNSLHARRQAFAMLRNNEAVAKLFDAIAPAFSARQGGYTRIYKVGTRPGDAADMALIEYLNEDILSAKVEGKVADEKSAPKKAKKAPAKKIAEKKEAVAPKAKKAVKADAEATDKPARKPRAKKATAE